MLEDTTAAPDPGDVPLHALAPAQIAEDLQVSVDMVQLMCRRGELPAFKVGSMWRVDATTYQAWKKARTRAETARRQRLAGLAEVL